jgi:hypothetical protein
MGELTSLYYMHYVQKKVLATLINIVYIVLYKITIEIKLTLWKIIYNKSIKITHYMTLNGSVVSTNLTINHYQPVEQQLISNKKKRIRTTKVNYCSYGKTQLLVYSHIEETQLTNE